MLDTNATFTQYDIDGKRTGFTVVPGKYVPEKILYGIIAGFVILVYIVLPESDSTVFNLIKLALAAGGGWWLYQNAGRWMSKLHDHIPGGQFVASVSGLEMPDGSAIYRDDFVKLSIENYDLEKPSAAVAYLLQVMTHSGGQHPKWIAGGMDQVTANNLLAAVKRALGLEAINASSPVAASAGMKVGDLLLTEVAMDVYEVQRKTATGHELAAKAPAGVVEALEFAQKFAGDTPLWYVKMAGRGEPPILVPKA